MERQPAYSADHLVSQTQEHPYRTLCNEPVVRGPVRYTSGSSHYTIAAMGSEAERFGTILCEKCNEVRCLVKLKDAVL
jgi:hypothetical protein